MEALNGEEGTLDLKIVFIHQAVRLQISYTVKLFAERLK